MQKLHYFLVCGEIIFHTADEQVGTIRLNALVTHDQPTIPVRLIGKAQQALQLNFFKKIDDAAAKVVDVVIVNFSSLGRMTEKEFHAAPAGMELQEKVTTTDNPFNDGEPITITNLN